MNSPPPSAVRTQGAARMIKSLARRVLRRTSADHVDVEKAEWKFYVDYVESGMTVLDIGANVGALTLLFAHFVREEGHVHAFEATSSTSRQLADACRASENVSVNHLAVGAEVGTAQLQVYDSDHASWNTMARRDLDVEVQPVAVEQVAMTTVDAYCTAKDIPVVDLLKVDVEGAEYQVLQGAKRMLVEKRIRCCTLEFGGTTFDMGNSPAEIQALLNRTGYSLASLSGGRTLFPGRQYNMLVARPK
jgi:FkbM family methyltransferase